MDVDEVLVSEFDGWFVTAGRVTSSVPDDLSVVDGRVF